MKMDANLILEFLTALEMDPHGVFTGVAGSVLSLFVLNGNSFGWKRVGLIFAAGIFICGYSFPWIEELVVSQGKTRAPAHLANMGIGFVSSDLLSSIKSAAPTLTNTLIKIISKFITNSAERFLPGENTPK